MSIRKRGDAHFIEMPFSIGIRTNNITTQINWTINNPLGVIFNDTQQHNVITRIRAFDEKDRWKIAFQKYMESSPSAAMDMVFNLYLRVNQLEEELKSCLYTRQ